ncbi:MAG: Na/Pi cotransporter family protein [Ruminococcaceae bacterium]|nr:Na/Pi cotransporter family protein [Oscillospiraceae bacterium]
MFLYGMKVMGTGLERVSGSKLEGILEKLSDKMIKGVLLGAVVTAIIQSSAATTVMVVGFVNSGIMKLAQATGIIMGANIGTTATAWILSLTGVTGDSFFVQILKPSNFAPLFAFVGIVMIMISKSSKKRDVGSILVGFGILMVGMNTMIDAMEPITSLPGFNEFLQMFTNPFLGVLVGFLLTTLLQSSSASIGIMQAMAVAGNVTYGFAIPMILGQNIGSCTTTLISCIGAKKNARRAALVHLYFNLIGVVLVFTLFYGIDLFVDFSFKSQQMSVVDIAILHSAFNIFSTLILMPFGKQLGHLATISVPDSVAEDKTNFLDERLLNTPSFAIERCKSIAVEMAVLAKDTLHDAVGLMQNFSEKQAQEIEEKESLIDTYEDKLGTYLVKLSGLGVNETESREISRLLYTIGDFERIGDHAVNLLKAAREMDEKGLSFSDEAKKDLAVLSGAIEEIIAISVEAFEKDDVSLAAHVEPFEQVIDGLSSEIKTRHIKRLQEGNCTIELGFILSDVLTNCERVSDHCSNIAVCIIQIKKDRLNTHQYLNERKETMGEDFVSDFNKYAEKYTLSKQY